jgi:hypothetical protein
MLDLAWKSTWRVRQWWLPCDVSELPVIPSRAHGGGASTTQHQDPNTHSWRSRHSTTSPQQLRHRCRRRFQHQLPSPSKRQLCPSRIHRKSMQRLPATANCVNGCTQPSTKVPRRARSFAISRHLSSVKHHSRPSNLLQKSAS